MTEQTTRPPMFKRLRISEILYTELCHVKITGDVAGYLEKGSTISIDMSTDLPRERVGSVIDEALSQSHATMRNAIERILTGKPVTKGNDPRIENLQFNPIKGTLECVIVIPQVKKVHGIIKVEVIIRRHFTTDHSLNLLDDMFVYFAAQLKKLLDEFNMEFVGVDGLSRKLFTDTESVEVKDA